MSVQVNDFKDRAAQADALAGAVAAALNTGLRTHGRASLAVPGGTTPGAFLTALGETGGIDWSGVSVTLTDERCVAPDDDRSNARLVRQTLMQAGATPNFIPLYAPDKHGGAALGGVETALADGALPLDALVLGMGNDGHTASLFPGSGGLDEALNPQDDAKVILLEAPGAPEPRISLTLPALVSARHIFVLIAGQDKRDTLDRVMVDGPVADAPIRAIFSGAETVAVYWAP